MEEILRNGGSIKSHIPLDPSTTTNHGTFKAMVEARRWKSQALTLTGGRSSHMLMNISSISRTEKHLMFMVEKMKKEEKSLSGASTVERTRDGKSSILTRQRKLLIKDLTRTLDL